MLLNPMCPCGTEILYTNCCEPYLSSKTAAPTAVALMRSRYSAYSKGKVDYLIQTQHPKNRKKDDQQVLTESMKATHWEELTILKTEKGTETDHRGIVEFVALYCSKNELGSKSQSIQKLNQLHERSRFVKEEGQWFYVDGDKLKPVKLKPKA